MNTKQSHLHGGKRTGSGRKPASLPLFTKAFRATDEERKEFLSLLTGDARKDFLHVMQGLRQVHTLLAYSKPSILDQALSDPRAQDEYKKLLFPKDKQS